jgi:uncharacterized integral membrane protein
VAKGSAGGAGGRRITAKQVVVGVLILVVVVLAIANSKSVRVDFLVADIRMPLFLVIVGSAIVGWVIGWFMGRSRNG